MADTIRTRAAILALLADNSTGNISPQDVRDMFVTCHGTYASLLTQDGSTAQTGITTTPAIITGWAADGSESDLDADYTANTITVSTDGVYLCNFAASFTGTDTTIYQAHLRVDAVEQAEGAHLYVATGANLHHFGFTAIKSLTAAQVVSVYIETDAGGGASFTPVDMQLTMMRLA